jgi:hypothetical protein
MLVLKRLYVSAVERHRQAPLFCSSVNWILIILFTVMGLKYNFYKHVYIILYSQNTVEHHLSGRWISGSPIIGSAWPFR